ncbi:MAG: cytochrome c nitrite reductase small subunit [Desulfobacteraceae bacterium]|nr:cytochrome c nitrite reductase small subunit [Desulfobacteraceae bacterium]
MVISAAVLAGLGILAAVATPKLLSLTSTPQFCNSCHVMNEEYETWFMTGIHRTIQCIDCHLPNDNILNHLIWKGIDGTRDVVYFHTATYAEPIEISERGKGFIKANCIRCHEGIVSRIATDDQDCWSCHRRINHKAAIFNSSITR